MLSSPLLLLGLAFSTTTQAYLFPPKSGIRNSLVVGRGGGPTSDDNDVSLPSRKKAIVVGSGPSGLAAALVLATLPNDPYDVTVLESTAGSTASSKYDVSKSYLYNVNARGQTLTKMFPQMQQKLVDRGVRGGGSSSFSIQYIPADPAEPLPPSKGVGVGGTNPKDSEAAKAGPISDDEEKLSYWIPRHEMVNLMQEFIQERDERQKRGDGIGNDEGRIVLMEGKECLYVVPAETTSTEQIEHEQVCVTVRDCTTGKEEQHLTQLVVGADGIRSNVRRSLNTMAEEYKVWPGTKHGKFNVKKYTTPATGLRLKALQLPPKFPIPNNDGTSIESFSKNMYVFIAKNKGPKDFVRFGLLPMIDNESCRPCNVITRPSHDIWKLEKDGEVYKEWFQKAFPRLPIQTNDKSKALFPDEEWDRFAKAEYTSFPPAQRCTGLAAVSPQGQAGVVLVGDACHAFSPDIGQGVNAGLADVVALGRALQGVNVLTGKEDEKKGNTPAVGTALKTYEHVRSPEIKALIRLARFGAPYQYNQPLYRDKIGKMLWLSNLVLRLMLNKLTFGIIPKQCLLEAQNPKQTFRKIMRKADTTTAGLVGVLLAGLWYTVLRKFVNFPLVV